MDKKTANEIKEAKSLKKKEANEAKLKEKQLEKQRTRIYNEMVSYQKKSQKKIKKAPKDAYISLKHINKIYDNKVQAVFDFNLDIAKHEFIVLVGPSGCGKSTTLRMIAGLESITAGDLFIDNTYANELHPKDRDIAMVFQSYALYPHMTVYENMAFALKIRKIPKAEIDERVKEVASILGLTEYLNRKPKALSGGQRQRVAVGRAIVRDANIYLFDEPLSNLDAKLRTQMRVEIIRLYEKLKTTFVYVTHDQVEAMTMGTRIVVMKDGIVQQIDTPTNLYDYPVNKFVAGFIGTPQMNFMNVKVDTKDDDVIAKVLDLNINLGKQKLDDEHLELVDQDMILGVRSEDIHVSAEGEEGIDAVVSVVESLGSECLVYMKYAQDDDPQNIHKKHNEIVMKIQGRCAYRIGDKIKISFNLANIHLFDSITERSVLIKK